MSELRPSPWSGTLPSSKLESVERLVAATEELLTDTRLYADFRRTVGREIACVLFVEGLRTGDEPLVEAGKRLGKLAKYRLVR
jgi:hypothetical protein